MDDEFVLKDEIPIYPRTLFTNSHGALYIALAQMVHKLGGEVIVLEEDAKELLAGNYKMQLLGAGPISYKLKLVKMEGEE